MKAYKRSITSSILGRAAHADVFELGSSPSFLFVLFGGSGIDDEEYERRSETVIPVFDEVLEGLVGTNAVVVHVTAPYDVPFNRFAENPSAAELWKAHVLEELLSPWSVLPYFVCSFSGGAALALNGLQREQRCFGGAALGADAIPKHFVCPDHWGEKLKSRRSGSAWRNAIHSPTLNATSVNESGWAIRPTQAQSAGSSRRSGSA